MNHYGYVRRDSQNTPALSWDPIPLRGQDKVHGGQRTEPVERVEGEEEVKSGNGWN
jgi:hypothetical protein